VKMITSDFSDVIHNDTSGFLNYLVPFSNYQLCPRTKDLLGSSESHIAMGLVHGITEEGFVCEFAWDVANRGLRGFPR
jgi:hypothetical protein